MIYILRQSIIPSHTIQYLAYFQERIVERYRIKNLKFSQFNQEKSKTVVYWSTAMNASRLMGFKQLNKNEE